MRISLIITTYNQPDALHLVLSALAAQTQIPHEVIIADDGSSTETADLLHSLSLPFVLHHVHQPDEGFRAAMARNRALAAASGDYVIFMDSDCVPLSHFVARHQQLAEAEWFVTGNRVLLSPSLTHDVLAQQTPLWQWPMLHWLRLRLVGDINHFLPLLPFLSNPLRYYQTFRWQGAKTCNLAAWRRDLLAINGFDEQFQGWGHEDADLVVRLLRYGIRRKSGRFAVPVLHLWHQEQDRSQEAKNFARLTAILNSNDTEATHGVNQYLKQTARSVSRPPTDGES